MRLLESDFLKAILIPAHPDQASDLSHKQLETGANVISCKPACKLDEFIFQLSESFFLFLFNYESFFNLDLKYFP